MLLQGYGFNPIKRVLFSVPVKYSGMGLIIVSEICRKEYENSRGITKETTDKVIPNEIQFQDNCVSTAKLKNKIKHQKKKLNDAKLQEVTKNICKTKLRLIETSKGNGASVWLTVISIKRNGFFSVKTSL